MAAIKDEGTEGVEAGGGRGNSIVSGTRENGGGERSDRLDMKDFSGEGEEHVGAVKEAIRFIFCHF